MMKQLWFRLALVMMAVAAISFGVIYYGFFFFDWAFESLAEQYFTPDELDDIEDMIMEEELPPGAEIIVDEMSIVPEGYQFLSMPTLFAFISISLAGLIAIWVAQKITKPIEDAAKQVSKLVKGDLDAKNSQDYPLAGSEITELCENLNHLADRLNERERRVRKDSASIAHELRTPLAVMTSQLHAMKDGIIEPNETELGLMLEKVEHLSKLVEDLRTISLVDAGELKLNLEETQLDQFIAARLADWQHIFEENHIKVETNLETVSAKIDQSRFKQIFENLFSNVIKYAKDGEYLGVKLQQVNGKVEISLTDKGPGLDLSKGAERYFEAFARGEDYQQSSGLGLAIVKSIVDAHNGEVTLSQKQESGLSLTIKL